MSGRHPFAELRARMSGAANARVEDEAQRLGKEMDLAELLRALIMSQEKPR